MDTASPSGVDATLRRLVVMRHATAEQTGITDHDRPLAERGHADAREAGAWLADRGVVPDAALVSSARRAHETWEAVRVGLGDRACDLSPDLSEFLYAAGSDTALDLVRETSDEIRTLLVIGHNPTMSFLVQMLDDGEGDAEIATLLATGGYPVCCLTVFAYDGEWADLCSASARVVAVHVGRG